jgi:hypothetical protein
MPESLSCTRLIANDDAGYSLPQMSFDIWRLENQVYSTRPSFLGREILARQLIYRIRNSE